MGMMNHAPAHSIAPPPNGLGAGGVVDEERIFELLERRDECRRRKDWEGADRLKDELSNVYNVIVNDRDRSWSIRAATEPPLPASSSNGGGRYNTGAAIGGGGGSGGGGVGNPSHGQCEVQSSHPTFGVC